MATFTVGDCELLLEKLQKESVDCVISSPPYGIGKSYEKASKIGDYAKWAERIVKKISAVVKPGGCVLWQVGNHVDDGIVMPLDVVYIPIFASNGFVLRNRIVWHFGSGLHATKRLSGRYETCLWFTKGTAKTAYTFNLDPIREPSKYPTKKAYKGPNKGSLSGNHLGKNPSDVWDIILTELDRGEWNFPNVKQNHVEKIASHPCQFPIELAERCVLAFSNVGDVILDPFCGVGSTACASAFHDRTFIGFETNSGYVEIARSRVSNAIDGTLKFRRIGTMIVEEPEEVQAKKYPSEWLPELKIHASEKRIVQTQNQRLVELRDDSE